MTPSSVRIAMLGILGGCLLGGPPAWSQEGAGGGPGPARAGQIEQLLSAGRDAEVAQLLPPVDTPEGLTAARLLLCRGARTLDVPGKEMNVRLRAILPRAALMSSEELVFPEILTRTAPEYPILARKARVTGEVHVLGVIDEAGKVVAAEVVKHLPMGLDDAARAAALQWTYTPATLNGMPVAVCSELVVGFSLQ